MEKLTLSDLEEILSFKEQLSSIAQFCKREDQKICSHIALLDLQAKHMRIYSGSDKDVVTFLTEPNGLTIFYEDNTDRAIGWKFPNKRAGTEKIQFEYDDDKLLYNSGKFEEVLQTRNPSAGLVQVINALEAAKNARNPTEAELILIAYENGVYLDGELETLKDNVQKTKTIILIDENLGPIIKPKYSYCLNEFEAVDRLSQLERRKIIDTVKRDYNPARLTRMIKDLRLIVDNDPRLDMVNYSERLLNKIESRPSPTMQRSAYMT
jgi:hypothetical protein